MSEAIALHPGLSMAEQRKRHVASFFVRGEPKGQPRARACIRGRHAGVYDPGTAAGWKNCIVRDARPHRPETPLEGPLIVSLQFHMPRPKSLMRRKDPDGCLPHTSRPDRDNLEKALTDCMKNDGWFRDDAQICGGPVEKVYHAKDAVPGCWISVQELMP